MNSRFRQAVILLTVAVSLFYLSYRVLFTLNTSTTYATFISVSLVLAEAYGITSVCLFALQVWDPRQPPVQPVLEGRTVDIFVPTYNEDPAILRATIEACMRIDYPGRRVYLCDDGGTEARCAREDIGPAARERAAELKAICEELGAVYLTRPKNEHAKAGNLNHAFTQTDGEFIIIFDADHVPEPHFIKRLIGYFADERLGYIQTPHAFYNFNSFQAKLDHKNRKYWEEGALFYEVIQPGRNRWNCPIFAGSAAMFRRKALEEVGYIALETITEDMHTGMRMNAKGWKSLAIAERMVAGQAAPDITTFHTQRLRWGEGNLSIMAYDNPATMRGLTLSQRFCYLGSMIHWAGGIFKLVIYVTPILMMLTGVSPVNEFTWTLFGLTALYMAVSLWGVQFASNGYGSILYGELFAMVNFWTQIRGTSRAIFWRKFQQFIVTSKRGRQSKSIWPFIAPQVYLFFASFLALAWGWSRVLYGISDDFFKPIIPTGWIVFHMALAAMAVRRALLPDDGRFSYRHAVNVVARYEDEHGTVGHGVTIDLNELGCGLVGFRPLKKGQVIDLALDGGGEAIRTRATVMWCAPAARGPAPAGSPTSVAFRIGVKFDPLDGKTFDAVNRVTLQYGVPRLYLEYAEGNRKGPLAAAAGVLRRLFNRGLIRGRVDHRRGYKLPVRVALADDTTYWSVSEDLTPTALAVLLPAKLTAGDDVGLTLLSPVGEVSGRARVMRAVGGVIGAKRYYRTVLEFHHLHGDGPNTIQELVSRRVSRLMHDALVPDPKPLPIPVRRPAAYAALAASAIVGVQLVAFPLVYANDIFLRNLAELPKGQQPTPEQVARFDSIYQKTLAQSYPSTDRLVLLMSCLPVVNKLDAGDPLILLLAGRDQNNDDLRRVRAHVLAKQKDYAFAEAEYKRLMELEKAGRLTESERAELRLNFARVAAYQRNWHEAADRFHEYLRLYPNDLPVRNEFAAYLISAQQAKDVPGLYDKVPLNGNSDDVYGARVMLMSAYGITNQFAQAKEVAEVIRQMRPDDPEALRVIADVMNLERNNLEARQIYERLAAQAGANPSVHVRLGQVYLSFGDWGKAADQFQQAYDAGLRSEDLFRGFVDAAAGFPPQAIVPLSPANRGLLDVIDREADAGALARNPEFLQRLAWVRQRTGNIDRAAILLERARSLAPNDPLITKQFFGLLIAQKRTPEAIALMGGKTDDPEVRRLLVAAYAQDGNFAKAAEEAEALRKATNNDPEATKLLADVLSWNKSWAKALELFKEVARVAPFDMYVQKRIAEILLWSGDTAAALAQYERLLTVGPPNTDPFIDRADLWPGFIDAAAGARQLNPAELNLVVRLTQQPGVAQGNNVTVLGRLGWVLIREKRAALAEPLLTRAAALAESEKPIVRKELAGVLAATNKPDLARAALKLYENVGPLDAADHKRLADIYSSLKMWPQAEAAAREYRQAKPGDPGAEQLLADVLSWGGKYGESLKLFAHLARTYPDDPEYPTRIAEVTQWSGDNGKALDLFAALLAKQPNDPRLIAGFVDSASGASSAPGLTPAQKAAVVRVIKATEFRPDDAARLGRLAWVCFQAGLPDEATRAAEKAAALNPTDPEVQKQLGGTLAALGKYELAVELFAPVALGSKDPRERLELVNLYTATKNYAKAEDVVNGYLAATKDDPRAQREGRRKLADVLGYAGKFPESLAIYEQLRKETPDDTELPIRIAEVTLWSGKPADALKTFTTALANPARLNQPELLKGFVDAAFAVPDLTAEQRTLVGRVYRRVPSGEWTDPGRVGRMAVLLHRVGDEKNSKLEIAAAQKLPVASPQARRELAAALAALGMVKDGVALFAGVPLTPDDRAALASLYAADKDWAKAEREAQILLDDNPNDTRAERLMADILAGKGDVPGAVALYDRLRKGNTADTELALRAGEVLAAADPDAALRRFAEILNKDWELPQARKGFVDAAAAAKALAPDEVAQAERLADDPATLKADDVPYLSRLSWVLIRAERPQKVKPLLDRAVTLANLEKPDAKSRRELAGVLAAAGRGPEALRMFGDGKPTTPEDHFLLANIYAAVKKFNPAVAEARAYLKAKPEDYKARRLLADLLSWNRDFDEALIDLRKLAADYPDDATIPTRIAQTTLWADRPGEAVALFAGVLKDAPQSKEAAAGFVQAAFAAGTPTTLTLDTADAVRAGLEAEDRPDPLTAAKLGYVYGKAGKNAVADGLFDRALSANPEDARTRRELAAVLDVAGRKKDADDLTAKLPFAAEDVFRAAEIYSAVRDYKTTIRLCQDILRRAESDRRAERLLADALTYDKQYAAGLARLRKLLAETPDDPDLPTRIAQTLVWDKRPAEAVKIYEAELQKDPARLKLVRGLVEAAAEPGAVGPEQTARVAQTAADAPLVPQIPDAGFQARLGRVYAAAGRGNDADRALDRALELTPKSDPAVRRDVASVMAAAGWLDQALGLLSGPDAGPEDLAQVAYIQAARKDWPAAAEAAAKYRAAFPNDPTAERLEAEVLGWSGNHREAVAKLRALLAKSPNDAELQARVAEETLWAGDPAGALQQFTDLLTREFDRPALWSPFLAAAAAAPGLSPTQVRLAEKVMAAVDAGKADDASTLARLAQVLFKLGKDAAAKSALDRALKLPLRSADARRELAGALATVGRWEDGLKLLTNLPDPTPEDRAVLAGLYAAGKKWAESEAIIRDLLKTKDDPALRRQLADVLAGRKEYVPALAVLDELRKRFPDDLGLTIKTGEVMLAADDPDGAVGLFAKVLHVHPEMPAARRGFVDAAAAIRHLDADEDKLAQAIAADPATLRTTDPIYLSRLAWVMIREQLPGKVNALLDRAVALGPTEPRVRRELAGVLAAGGRGAEAIKLFGTAPPTDPEDNYLLANIHASMKDFAPAIKECREYLKANPKAYKARRLLADLLSWDRDFDEALVEFEKLRKEDPTDRAIPLRIAETTLWAFRPQEALERFTALLADNPDPRVVAGFVRAAFEVDTMSADALAAIQKVRDLLAPFDTLPLAPAAAAGGWAVTRDDGFALARTAVTGTMGAPDPAPPVDPLLLARLGYVFAKAGRDTEAAKLFARAVVTTPADDTRTRREVGAVLDVAGRPGDARAMWAGLPFVAEDLYQTAQIYAAVKTYGPAITLMTEVLAKEPDNRRAELLLADCLVWSRDYPAGIARYKKLLKETPDDPDLPARIAQAYVWAEQPEQAVPIYTAELKKRPGKPKLIRGLIDALYALGGLSKAQAALVREVYESGPTAREIPQAGFQAKLGRVLQQAGMMAEAAKALDLAEATVPREPVVRREVAAALAAAGRPAAALKLFEGLDLGPADHLQLAYLYTAEKNWAAAEAEAEAYRNAFPDRVEAERLYADVLAWGGNREKALAVFEDLRKRYPADKDIPVRIAEVNLWGGEPTKALDQFTAILTAAPDTSKAWAGFVAAAAQAASLTEAQAAVALGVLGKLDLDDSTDPSLLARAARVYAHIDRTAEANKLLDRALKLPIKSGENRRELALALAEAKREKEGLALFQDVAKPTAADQETVAGLYAAGKEWNDAEKIVRRLLEDKPKDKTLSRRLADILAGKGDVSAALELLEELRKAAPEDIELEVRTAEVMAGTDPDGAVGLFADVLARNPDLMTARRGYVDAAASARVLTAGRARVAVRIADDPNTLKSNSVTYLCRLAWILIRERQPGNVNRLLDRAMALKPADLATRRELAGVLAAAGRPAEALKWFGDTPPVTPEDFFLLANIHAALKDFARALANCREFMKLKPGEYKAERLHADILSWNRDFDEAILEFLVLRRKYPQEKSIPIRIAETELWADRAGEALVRFIPIVLDDPKQPWGVAGLVASALEVDQVPEAAIVAALRVRDELFGTADPALALAALAGTMSLPGPDPDPMGLEADPARAAVTGVMAATRWADRREPVVDPAAAAALGAMGAVRRAGPRPHPLATLQVAAINAPRAAVLGGPGALWWVGRTDDPLLIARLGYLFYKAGRTADALPLFSAAAEMVPPGDTLARREVGAILDVAGWHGEAERLWAGLPFVAEDLYRVALVYVGVRDYQAAIRVCREIIRREPTHRKSERLLADALTWDKQYDEGLALLQKLLDQTPDDPDLPTRIAQTLVWAGRPHEAMKRYAAELDKYPGKPKLIRGFLEAAAAANSLTEAEAGIVAKMYREYPVVRLITDPGYLAHLGRALLLAGLTADGEAVLDRVARTPIYDARVRREVASILALANRIDAALRLFDGVEAGPDDFLQLAYLNTSRKDWAAAEKAARAYRRAFPNDARADRLVADVLSWAGRFDEALDLFRALRERYPQDPEIPVRIAETTLWAGDADAALDQFVRLLTPNLDRPRVWPGFLAAAGLADLTPEATALAGKVLDKIDVAKADDPVLLARAGRVLARLGRTAEAVAAFDRALTLPLVSMDVRRELAGVLGAAGRTDAALRLFDGVKLTADDRFVMAGVYAAGKRWTDAESLVRLLLRDKPGDLPLQRQLADVLVGKEDYAAALALFDSLRKAFPNNLRLAVSAADAALAAGEFAAATEQFTTLLERRYDLLPARRGLVNAAAAVPSLSPNELKYVVRIGEDPATLRAEDPVFLSRLAWALIREGKPALAAPLLDKAVALAPTDPAVRRELAGVLAAAGRAAEALRMFGPKPETPEDMLRLANIYAALKDFPAAIREAKAYLAAKPGDKRGERLLADLYSWGGWHDEALTLFEKLAALPNPDPALAVRIGETLLWSGRSADALERFTRLLTADPNRLDVAAPFVSAAFEVRPLPPAAVRVADKIAARFLEKDGDPLAVAELGFALLRAGNKALGTALLDKAVALTPPGDAGRRREVAAVLALAGRTADVAAMLDKLPPAPDDLLRAVGVFQAGKDFKAAATLLEQVLELRPGDVKLERMLADSLAWDNQYAAAIRLFRKLLRQDPGDVKLRVRLAETLLWSGAAAEALRAFDAELTADPTNPRLLAGFAEAASEVGRLTAAQKALAVKAYRGLPDTLATRSPLFLARVARMLQLAGLPDEAAALFSRAATVGATTAEGRRELAGLFSAGGRYDDAIKLFDGVDKDAADLARLVYLQAGRKDWAAAEAAAQAYQKTHPGAAADRLYADVLSWSGRHDDAIKLFERLRAANPNDPTIPVRIAETRLWGRDAAAAATAFAAVLASEPAGSNPWKAARDGFATAVLAIQDPTPRLIDQAAKLARGMSALDADEAPLTAARLAAVLTRAGRPAPAGFADRVSAITPNDDNSRRELAAVLAALGRRQQALDLYKGVAQTADDWAALAGLFAQGKDFASAERVARDALAENPRDPKFQRLLADVLSWKGDYKAAADEYQRLIDQDPSDVSLQIQLAQIFLWNKQYGLAAQRFEPLLEKDPTRLDLAAPYFAALANDPAPPSDSEAKLALRIAATADARAAKDVPFLANVAWVLHRIDKPEPAKGYLDFALELDPQDGQVRKNLAGVLEVFGRTKDALRMFEGLTLTPGDRFRLAGLYATDRQFDRAEDEVRAVLAADPNNTKALRLLADVLSWNEKYKETGYKESLELFARLRNLPPTDPNELPVPVRIAEVTLWAGDYDRASDLFAELLRQDFNRPPMWPEFVDAAASKRKPTQADGAIAARVYDATVVPPKPPIKQMYPYPPTDPVDSREVRAGLLPTRFLSRLAWVLFQAGDKPRTAALLNAAIARNPEVGEVRRELAGVLAATGRYAEARKMYEGIAAKYLDWMDSVRIAELFTAEGSFGRAQEQLVSVIRARPAERAPRLLLADVLIYSKQYPEALRLIDEMARAYPGDPAVEGRLAIATAYSGRAAAALPIFIRLLERNLEQPNLWQPFLDAVAAAPPDTANAALVNRVIGRLDARIAVDPDAYAGVGLALVRVGQGDRAVAGLRRALQVRPESQVLRRRLADTLSALGRTEEAEEQYEILLRQQRQPADVIGGNR